MASTFTDYQSGGGAGQSSASDPARAGAKGDEYWSLAQGKKAYLNYLDSKRAEIEEQQDARRYRHGSQWTAEQIRILKKRKQPVVTFNRIGRKIDGIVGLIERQRQDPKAFPRTPKHEEGAELATAVLRYVLDQQDWKAKSPIVASDGAVDGIGGIEINIIEGDRGDKEVEFDIVDPDSFFYDPRSFRLDFTDARYMGVGKWVAVDLAKEMFPDKAAEIDASVESGTDLTSNSDKDHRWFAAEGDLKRIRLIDLWYRHKGGWCFCLFTGSLKLMEGKSYLTDEKGKPACKYIMFSGNVDQDGDRYGFVRNLKSPQDSLNFKESKLTHILGSKRLIMSQSAVQDVEVARREWARPDGVIITNPDSVVKADDLNFEFAGWAKLLEEAKNEIENFSFNPSLIGTGVSDMSGRAIALQQQAGMAELGPYILAYRGWKVRVYRAVFSAIQRHWSGERWVRVTDDDNVAQFIQINGVGIDPQTGMPAMVNAIGSLDVDIILDEGPDMVNMQADAFDSLTKLLPSTAPLLQPGQAQVILKAMFELAPIPQSVKKSIRDGFEQSAQPQQDPAQQAAQQLQMAAAVATVKKTEAEGHDREASAILKEAQTQKTVVETQLAPAKAAHDAQLKEAAHHEQMVNAREDRQQAREFKSADLHEAHTDRQFAHVQSDADRQLQARQFEQRQRQQEAAPA